MSLQVRIDRPEDKEVQLSESQNLFRKTSDKVKFIANSYLLYFFTFIPAIILVCIASQNSKMKKFIKIKEEFIIVSALIAIAVGFGLAFSKIFARKTPFNYLGYILYLVSYAFTLSGIAVEFDFQLTLVFLVLNAVQSLGGLIYSAQSPKNFAVRQGIFFVFGFLLIPYIIFGFLFKKKLFEVSLLTLIVALTGTFILYTSRLLVRNKSFQMLPEDYIMGAMKYATILPLLAEVSVEQQIIINKFKQKMEGDKQIQQISNKFGLPIRKTIYAKSLKSTTNLQVKQSNFLESLPQKNVDKKNVIIKVQDKADKYLDNNKKFYKVVSNKNQPLNHIKKQQIKEIDINASLMMYSNMYNSKKIDQQINYLKNSQQIKKNQKSFNPQQKDFDKFINELENELGKKEDIEEKEANQLISEVFVNVKQKLVSQQIIKDKMQLIKYNKNVEDGD